MASAPSTEQRFQRTAFQNLGGGVNRGVFPAEIADDEFVSLINMEYDRLDGVIPRTGFVRLDDEEITDPVDSLYFFRDAHTAHGPHLIAVAGNDLLDSVDGGVSFASIKGALTIPDDQKWSWATFQDLAIGVTPGLILKYDGDVAATALGGSPPSGVEFVEVFNSRGWLAGGHTLYWSKLGDVEDWTDATSGSLDVDPDSGEKITGLYAHKGFLFIFQRRKIFRLVTGSPNTAAAQFSIELVSRNIGCIDGRSIQAILDDLVFLSEAGVASLAAAEIVGDFASAIVSKNVPELNNINPQAYIGSVVNAAESQYWLAVPDPHSANLGATTVWVMDFKRVPQATARWTQFTGLAVGRSYAIYVDPTTGAASVRVGGSTGGVYRHKTRNEANAYSDDGAGYLKVIASKSLDLAIPANRKDFFRWGAQFRVLTETVTIQPLLFVDNDFENSLLLPAIPVSVQVSNALVWGSGLWDVHNWDGGVPVHTVNVLRRIMTPQGRRFGALQLVFSNDIANEAFEFRNFFVDVAPITHKRVK